MTAPDDGLDAWLAGLAGRPAAAPAAASRPEQAEAALLRRLVAAQRAQREHGAQAPSAASEAAHWQRVRLRLGLDPQVDTQSVTSPARPQRWAANQPRWAWAAGLAALAAILPWALQPLPGTEPGAAGDGGAGVVMRGGAAPQVLLAHSAGQAATLADHIEQVLRAYQQTYRRLPLNNAGWQIQAKVAPGSAAAAALSRDGVVVPAGGRVDLQVLVKAAAPVDPVPNRAMP